MWCILVHYDLNLQLFVTPALSTCTMFTIFINLSVYLYIAYIFINTVNQAVHQSNFILLIAEAKIGKEIEKSSITILFFRI